jgi:parvulin-like peptidyl-prolyl isomerase
VFDHGATMTTLLTNHLLHFVVLGGVIFAAAPRPRTLREIEISSADLRAMGEAQARRKARAVDNVMAETILSRAIEDEVLYREALRLGLDKNDNIVRQRLIQKALYLAEDLESVQRSVPDEELIAFYEKTKERWKKRAWTHFIHVYAKDEASLAALEPTLDPHALTPPPVGEAFPLSRDVRGYEDEIAAHYGKELALRSASLPSDRWSGPVASSKGWHLIKVVESRPGGVAPFSEVKGEVQLAYLLDRKQRAASDYLTAAYARYQITVDGRPYSPSRTSERASNANLAGED